MAAAVTERVELVTNVLISPLRNGAILAKQADSLDRASGGRLTLGLGVGLRDDDFKGCDVDIHVRGALLDQHIRQLSGRRMLIGGEAQHAARRLMTAGDGWTMMIGSPDEFEAGYTAVHGAWACAGRPGRPRGMALFYAALGDDAEQLAHKGAGYYSWLGPQIAGLRGVDRHHSERRPPVPLRLRGAGATTSSSSPAPATPPSSIFSRTPPCASRPWSDPPQQIEGELQ